MRSSRPRVISATRLHFPPGTAEIPEATQQHLRAYALATKELGIEAAIAVNCLQDRVRQIIQQSAPTLSLQVLHVPVWGAFVPALNTLLGEAQRRGMEYILYQSLEVTCKDKVLRFLLNFHTRDTLVIGPVLDGHTFEPGIRPLHGRTAPWNTLAIWSVRKLALTGFLSIAEGLPTRDRFVRQMSGDSWDSSDSQTDRAPMGSESWWTSAEGLQRQQTEVGEVPAGVEEVTAIALLQHVLGKDRAVAVLVDLTPELLQHVSWKASWGMDERRRKWHETKMASKVSRPAAQIQQLFKHNTSLKQARANSKHESPAPLVGRSPLMQSLFGRRRKPRQEEEDDELEPGPAAPEPVLQKKEQSDNSGLYFGVVHHFGESIRPPLHVERICLVSFMLFSANFASVFSAAFSRINSTSVDLDCAMNNAVFVSWLIGGAYLPMPASLWLLRQITMRRDHIAGLAMFAFFLILAHSCIVVCQLMGASGLGWWRDPMILVARGITGLSSGVLFQSRYILASLSTQDHHLDLQVRSFLATDIGLGIGALLPAMSAFFSQSCPAYALDLLPSALLAVLSLAFLIWVLAEFPNRLFRLPDKVRFAAHEAEPTGLPPRLVSCSISSIGIFGTDMDSCRRRLLLSGTARVFVQSGVFLAAALCVRDGGFIGNFRQTKIVAALCFLQVPFEALASGLCGGPSKAPWKRLRRRRLSFGSLAVFMVLCILTRSFALTEEHRAARCTLAAAELAALLVALAIATPDSVSRLNGLPDSEHCMVTLEWAKAYIGRLLGFVFALVTYRYSGYMTLLGSLSAATLLVVATA